MKRAILLICSALFYAPMAFAQSEVPPPSRDYTVVVLGDQMSDDVDFLEEDTLEYRLHESLLKQAKKDRIEVKN